MKLSNELYEEIRAALTLDDSPPPPQPQTNRRGIDRIPVDMEVTIEPYGVAKGRPRTARLKNFSSSGVSIFDTHVVRADEQFIIHLPRGAGTVPLICTVKNCRLRSDGLFRVGAQFTSHAEKSRNCRPMVRGVAGLGTRNTDLELLRSKVGPSHKDGDRRSSARIDRVIPLLIMPCTGNQRGPIILGELRDISLSGLCIIIHAHHMTIGQEFLAQAANEQGQHWKRYVVVSCRPMDDGRFRIGAAEAPRGLGARLRRWFRPEAKWSTGQRVKD